MISHPRLFICCLRYWFSIIFMPKYFVLIQPYAGHICWNSCLWTGPMRHCTVKSKSRRTRALKMRKERNRKKKGAHTKEVRVLVGLLQSPPPYILWSHMDRCNLNCVAMDVSLIPSLYSRSPLLFLLHWLSSGGCWLQILPYMVILSSPPVNLPDPFPLSSPLAEAQCLRPIVSLIDA